MVGKGGVRQAQATCGELTYAEIAGEVEVVFGEGTVGLGGEKAEVRGEGGDGIAEIARATFVDACILLVVKQRCDAIGFDRREHAEQLFRIIREVRQELAVLLAVDENEVFRFRHHAEGLRTKDPGYRKAIRALEQRLAKRYGMVV